MMESGTLNNLAEGRSSLQPGMERRMSRPGSSRLSLAAESDIGKVRKNRVKSIPLFMNFSENELLSVVELSAACCILESGTSVLRGLFRSESPRMDHK